MSPFPKYLSPLPLYGRNFTIFSILSHNLVRLMTFVQETPLQTVSTLLQEVFLLLQIKKAII